MTHDEELDAFDGPLLVGDAEQLYDRAPVGYLSTAPDGAIVKVNETFLRLTGYRRDELVGRRTFSDLLTAGGRIYHETHYAPMLQMQGHAREIALDLVVADGRRLPVLVNAVLERDAGGAPVVVRAAIFDATDRREYERELVRALRRAEESEARSTALARTLQETLIPPAVPRIPGLEVSAAYRPAGRGDEIGGDFYDVFEIATDDWVVAVGDVCGKGAEAAVVTALARWTVRAECVRLRDASDVLETLNEVLLHHEARRFCTVLLVRLRRAADGVDGRARWTATVASGGHPLPLVRRARSGVETVGRPGTLLGALKTATLHEVDVVLEPGDVLVAYTDGVTEGRRGTEFYGRERLDVVVAALAPGDPEAAPHVLADVVEFQEGLPRDDIAIVALALPT